jgi:predicted nucleotidyltransferase component of viral defense system
MMAFKGGTSLMFFHDLNRFSTDLDFNLINPEKLDIVYDKVRAILTQFGSIDDEAKKLYGPVLVLNCKHSANPVLEIIR